MFTIYDKWEHYKNSEGYNDCLVTSCYVNHLGPPLYFIDKLLQGDMCMCDFVNNQHLPRAFQTTVQRCGVCMLVKILKMYI